MRIFPAIVSKFAYVFCLFILSCPMLAQDIDSIKREILELEIEMLMIENDPSKRDTLELMRKKHQILHSKLQATQPKSNPQTQRLSQPQHHQTTQTNPQSAKPASLSLTSQTTAQTKENPNTHDPKHRRKNRSGMLLGLSIGGMDTESTYHTLGGLLPYTLKANATPVGLRIGWQTFGDGINEKMRQNPIGLRLYIDSHAFIVETKDLSAYAIQGFGAYNADLLAEFNIPGTYIYLGGFGGVGYGMLFYEAQSTWYKMNIDMTGLFYNLGAALTLGAKHRLEFYYKFLPKNSYTNASEGIYWKSSDFMGFAYQYTF